MVQCNNVNLLYWLIGFVLTLLTSIPPSLHAIVETLDINTIEISSSDNYNNKISLIAVTFINRTWDEVL